MCEGCAAARRSIESRRALLSPPDASLVALVENFTRQPLPSQRPSNLARCCGSASVTATRGWCCAAAAPPAAATARSSHLAAQSWSAASSGGKGPRENDHWPEASSARQPVTARPAERHAARCASATALPFREALLAFIVEEEGEGGAEGELPLPSQGKQNPAPPPPSGDP